MDSLATARDAFQERLLAALYKARAPGELILKGGGAMKVRNQGARFTKDLDLDHDPHRGLDSLIKSVRKAIDQAFGGGFKKVEVSEPKQTETVARWKIQATAPDGQEFQLTVEVSRRHEIDMEDVEASIFRGSDKGLARVYIDVYKGDKLVEMKLRALLDEVRVAPRDIYDLDLLIADGARPADEAIADLQQKYGDLAERTIAKMEGMPWTLFESQTLPAIPDDLRARVTEKEYGAMKDRILSEILKWTAQPARAPSS
jgi:hypothetical protein